MKIIIGIIIGLSFVASISYAFKPDAPREVLMQKYTDGDVTCYFIREGLTVLK